MHHGVIIVMNLVNLVFLLFIFSFFLPDFVRHLTRSTVDICWLCCAHIAQSMLILLFVFRFLSLLMCKCFSLEPIFSQVAQQLYNVEPDIIVGRVDCIHYSGVAKHFAIQGFPTVLYINKNKRIEYRGDRILEELVEFALRVHGPPVRYLAACSQIAGLVEKNRVLFVNFGPNEDKEFVEIAPQMQPTDWFFRSIIQCDSFEKAGVYVVKARNVTSRYG